MATTSALARAPRAATVGVLALLTLLAVTVGFGRMTYAVTNGVSMKPTYRTGDLVVVARSHSYGRGQVIAYRSSGVLVLHRIVGGDASGFVTKGDNNQSTDPTKPRAGQVMGRVVLHIPKVGAPLREPIVRGLFGGLALVLVGGLMFAPRAKHAIHRTNDTPHGRILWKRLVAFTVVVFIALAASFAVAVSHHRPVAARTQTARLRYHASTPVSDTYPTGEIVTGNPVFTNLVNAVELTFGYTTHAPPRSVRGTARIDLALSTPTGWHSALPLVPPTDLVAGAAGLSGTLDVARIQELAASVATATGLNAGLVDVVVDASVDLAVDGAKSKTYSFGLPFKLTAFALTMSGPAPTAARGGPALSWRTPVGAPGAAPDGWARVGHQVREGLLAVFLLCAGATVVLAPTKPRPRRTVA
jgi:signal peptidase I